MIFEFSVSLVQYTTSRSYGDTSTAAFLRCFIFVMGIFLIVRRGWGGGGVKEVQKALIPTTDNYQYWYLDNTNVYCNGFNV